MKYKIIPKLYSESVDKYADRFDAIEVNSMEEIFERLAPRLYNENTKTYAKIHKVIEVNNDMQYIIFDENYSLNMSEAEYEAYILGIL